MTDPESGLESFNVGAPADSTSDHAASDGAHSGQKTAGSTRIIVPGTRDSGNGGGASEHPQHGTGDAGGEYPTRKRKRRRRGRKSKSHQSETQTVVADVNAAGGDETSNAKGGGRRGGKTRRRKRRALQGRPLTCGGNGQDKSDQPNDASTLAVATALPCNRDQSAPAGNSALQPNRPERGRAHGKRGGGSFYAALDLGTNNCRLLIAQPTRPGQFRVVDAFSRIVRLGEGLIGSGRLSQGAMDRAVEALKVCAAKLERRPIRNRRLIATEACRKADNGMEFIERVRHEAGLDLEIVDRETEARLAVSGCASLVDRDARSVVLFDIGGGSSEIAVIDLEPGCTHRPAGRIRAWTSLPVGVVTLSELHGGREVTPEVFDAMVRDVEGMLRDFECPRTLTGHHSSVSPAFHLLGTSGTVTTLAGVYLDLPRYDRRRVDGLWLSNEDVDRMMERLLSWDFDQRSANPCIGADRADLVLAGCAILEAIRRRWPSERMRVADRGLREGLLTEMMAADGVWRRNRRGWRGMARMGAS